MEKPMTALRADLETLPDRMKSLPVDERGYVVPWFVAWEDGKPEFRAMDGAKWREAVRFRKCWVCGERLGRHMTFVAGPMCGINRTSSEPPSHLECAQWSARNCPFLNNPEMVRRVDDKLGALSACPGVAGFGIERNPGVTMLWTCTTYSIFTDGKGGQLISMGEPESVEWYRCGKKATRDQVLESIETGLPALVAVAQQQEGAMKYLDESRRRFMRYLP